MVIYQFYADCKPKMAISVEQHRKSFQNQDDNQDDSPDRKKIVFF
jgi:hypothetical protein